MTFVLILLVLLASLGMVRGEMDAMDIEGDFEDFDMDEISNDDMMGGAGDDGMHSPSVLSLDAASYSSTVYDDKTSCLLSFTRPGADIAGI